MEAALKRIQMKFQVINCNFILNCNHKEIANTYKTLYQS